MSKYINKYKVNIARVKFQVTKLRNSIFKFPGPINQQIKFTKSHQNFPNWQKSDLKQQKFYLSHIQTMPNVSTIFIEKVD